MATTILGITLTQGLEGSGCSLISGHNPIVYIAEVAYSGDTPEELAVHVYDKDSVLLGEFVAVNFEDNAVTGTRSFAFYADEVFRAFMDSFDDFHQGELETIYCESFTKQFTVTFGNPAGVNASSTATIAHAKRQFGQEIFMKDICGNTPQTFYGAIGMPVYIYFFNSNEGNEFAFTIDGGELSEVFADYDDTPFADYDDYMFESD